MNQAMNNDCNTGKILHEAYELINGQRQTDYGPPAASFQRIASFWTIYLHKEISAKDVAMLMLLLKVARECSGQGTHDSLVDIAGYAALAADLSQLESAQGQCDEAPGEIATCCRSIDREHRNI